MILEVVYWSVKFCYLPKVVSANILQNHFFAFIGAILLTRPPLDRTESIQALVSLLTPRYPTPHPSNGDLTHVIDFPHSSRLIKLLIQGGHYNKHTSSIDPAPNWPSETFVDEIVKRVSEQSLQRMAYGNGTFVLAELVGKILSDEGKLGEQRVFLKKSVFDDEAIKAIKDGKPKGWEVLMEKIEKL